MLIFSLSQSAVETADPALTVEVDVAAALLEDVEELLRLKRSWWVSLKNDSLFQCKFSARASVWRKMQFQLWLWKWMSLQLCWQMWIDVISKQLFLSNSRIWINQICIREVFVMACVDFFFSYLQTQTEDEGPHHSLLPFFPVLCRHHQLCC